MKVSRAGKESGEEIDDVVVRTGVEEYLAVETARHLEAQVVGGIVFGGKARLKVETLQGGVIDHAHAWIGNEFAGIQVVGAIHGERGARLPLLDGVAVVVDKSVVGGVALDAQAILHLVLSEEIGDLHRHVESANLTEFVVFAAVVQGDVVFRIGNAAVQNGRRTRDKHEVGAGTDVLPMVVGDGLVAVHTVVKAETEEVQLAAGAGVEGEFAVEVEEVEGQSSVHVVVENLGTF